MKNEAIIMKNKKTGEKESIIQHDMELKDWGFTFFVDTEIDAYKAAYAYKGKQTKVEFSMSYEKWYVTVYK